mgnify:CR=1 FL=1
MKKIKIVMPTDEEDKLYTIQAKEDDNELADQELSEMVPVGGVEGLKKLENGMFNS